MKIQINESQLKYITEYYWDSDECDFIITNMNLKDGKIMIKYKEEDSEEENITSYRGFQEICDSDPMGDLIVNYLKDNNLNLGNSPVLRELFRLNDDFINLRDFQKDENGRYYPHSFLLAFRMNDRKLQNDYITYASRLLSFLYNSNNYPITVYRGIESGVTDRLFFKPKDSYENYIGDYWSTNIKVALRFSGKSDNAVIYTGLIHKPEDVNISATILNRLQYGKEFEINSSKVEIIEKKYYNEIKKESK
jgi:hypothetical protein